MKEIEILVEVFDPPDVVLQRLEKFAAHGIAETKDIYFCDPLRPDLQPDVDGRLRRSCRLRHKDGKASVAYKVDHFLAGDIWHYSDEYETEVADGAVAMQFLEQLGLQKLVTIASRKHKFTSGPYEIVFEQVEGLGNFLEVEFQSEADDVDGIKRDIWKFMQGLGLAFGPELNAGKPELMLRKIAEN